MSETYNISPSGCWEWNKSKAGKGYGVLSFFKRNYYVHRVSYRIFKGEIPQGLCILHACDNPKCFNPDHLFLGTHKDNVDDMIKKGRNVKADMRGEKNPRCKYADSKVILMRKDFDNGFSLNDLVKKYKISKAQVHKIVNRKVRLK